MKVPGWIMLIGLEVKYLNKGGLKWLIVAVVLSVVLIVVVVGLFAEVELVDAQVL